MSPWNRKCMLRAVFLSLMVTLNLVDVSTSLMEERTGSVGLKKQEVSQDVPPVRAATGQREEGGESSITCPVSMNSFIISSPRKFTHLNPEKPAIFKVGLQWTPGLMMKLVALNKDKVYFENSFTPENAQCGTFQKKDFIIWNQRHNNKTAQKGGAVLDALELEVIVSIGKSPADDKKHCLNLYCKTFELSYDFRPNPESIKVHHSPKTIKAGQKGVIQCSNTDGKPVAEPFAIQVVDRKTAKPILVANVTKLEMQSALAGRYQCLVLSQAFERDTVVASAMSVDVMQPPAGKHKRQTGEFLRGEFDLDASRPPPKIPPGDVTHSQKTHDRKKLPLDERARRNWRQRAYNSKKKNAASGLDLHASLKAVSLLVVLLAPAF